METERNSALQAVLQIVAALLGVEDLNFLQHIWPIAFTLPLRKAAPEAKYWLVLDQLVRRAAVVIQVLLRDGMLTMLRLLDHFWVAEVLVLGKGRPLGGRVLPLLVDRGVCDAVAVRELAAADPTGQ